MIRFIKFKTLNVFGPSTSIKIKPKCTTATYSTTPPFPLPIRDSIGFLVIIKLGCILNQILPNFFNVFRNNKLIDLTSESYINPDFNTRMP